MTQASLLIPNQGPHSMQDLADNYFNVVIKALFSSSAGTSPPDAGVTNIPAEAGPFWLDKTSNPYVLRIGDGAGGWCAIGTVDPATHTFVATAPHANIRRAVADTSTTATKSDRMIAYTSLTAPRTVTLPAANTFPAGTSLIVVDESGAASAANVISIARAGSDTINGGAASAAIVAAYGYVALESDGTSKWTLVNQNILAASAYLDAAFGAVRGSALVRGQTGWLLRTPSVAGQSLIFDGADTGFATAGAATTLFPGMLFGHGLANNGTSSLDIAPGTAASDDASVRLTLTATLTKSIASAWAAGTGNGGLDTGAVAANTWYHVFLIYNPSGPTTEVLFSLSSTAPTLPSGYTRKRRIGSVRTNASSQITPFVQTGDRFDWGTPVLDYNATPGTGAAVTITLADVPSGIVTQAQLVARGNDGSATASIGYVSSLAQTDVATSASALTFQTGAANTNITANILVVTNTAQQIRIRGSTSSLGWLVIVTGWIDTRGK